MLTGPDKHLAAIEIIEIVRVFFYLLPFPIACRVFQSLFLNGYDFVG